MLHVVWRHLLSMRSPSCYLTQIFNYEDEVWLSVDDPPGPTHPVTILSLRGLLGCISTYYLIWSLRGTTPVSAFLFLCCSIVECEFVSFTILCISFRVLRRSNKLGITQTGSSLIYVISSYVLFDIGHASRCLNFKPVNTYTRYCQLVLFPFLQLRNASKGDWSIIPCSQPSITGQSEGGNLNSGSRAKNARITSLNKRSTEPFTHGKYGFVRLCFDASFFAELAENWCCKMWSSIGD